MDEVEPKYNPINSYTLPPSIEQVALLIYFFTLLILHSVFIASAIPIISSPILYVIQIVMYVLLIGMLLDYCRITMNDPVDPIVAARSVSEETKGFKFCYRCSCYRENQSHHCGTCDRCTGEFDHHCTYLNNCIGGSNYKWFIRLLLSALGYCMCLMGQGVWVFVAAQNDSGLDQKIMSKWTIIGIIAVLVPGMIVVILLLIFHLYITLNKQMTTYQFLISRGKGQQQQIQKDEKNKKQALPKIQQEENAQDLREKRIRAESQIKSKLAGVNHMSQSVGSYTNMVSNTNLIKSEFINVQPRFEDIPLEPQIRNVSGQQFMANRANKRLK